MKHVCLALLCIAAITSAFGQSPYVVDLPQILPASPDASNFVKAGVGNANTSSGAATAEIPLYTIQVRDFKMPISLSYSTQGLKVDESSSRVGYGWTLGATGVITRSVRGEPDEFSGREAIPSNLVVDDPGGLLYSYYQRVSAQGSGYDSQPDEFQFNVNGYSGKFVLDGNYEARITSTSNLLIVVEMIPAAPGTTSGSINNIFITAPDGIKYTFGTNYEITTNVSAGLSESYKAITKTSFYLDRVDLPTGEYLLFNYTSINTNVSTGISQTLTFSMGGGPQDCGACNGSFYPPPSTNRVWYQTRYLTSITTSTGLTVNLTYENQPGIGGDKRLTQLEVVGVKRYQLGYTGSERFFLTSVSDITLGGGPNALTYTFGYDRLEDVPPQLSYNQDYLGFHNGGSHTYLIPPGKNSSGVMDFSFREPNVNAAKIGTLTSITYPTAGTEEFIYEGNTVSKISRRDTSEPFSLHGVGGGSAGSSYIISYPRTFTVPRDQTIAMKFYAVDADPGDGYVLDPVTDASKHTAKLRVYDGSGNIGGPITSTCYTPNTLTVSLLAGHTYTIELSVYSYTEHGYVTFSYENSAYDIYDTLNVVVPGVRLRQVKLTDPFTGGTVNKYYTYATLAHPDRSTGQCLSTSFASSARKENYCGDNDSRKTECVLEIYSSNTTSFVYDLSGSGSSIYYPVVLESDDPDFANGGTEYQFYPNDNGTATNTVIGFPPYIFGGHNPSLTGKLKRKRVFAAGKSIVHEEQTDYETLIFMSGMPQSLYVRKNYQPSIGRPDRLMAYDVAQVFYGNYWIREKTQTVKEYAGPATKTTISDYAYGTTTNVLPASVTTTDSKGVVVRSEFKYPNTYQPTDGNDIAPLGYYGLILKNILTPVVQESSFKNDVLMQRRRTLYKDWFSNFTIVTPEKVQVMKSATDNLNDVIQYSAYDVAGNPNEVKKANDFPVVYLWDKTHSLPVCEVKNATTAQVAYTSFETADYGYWENVSSGTINSGAGFSGQKNFSGTITRTVPSGTYQLSLWTTGTSPTAGSMAGTLLATTTSGWKLYSWTLPNPGTITVTGTNIDEVRLMPVGAMMESYVHKPFIGVIAKIDANNRITIYEYDALGRLTLIRNDKNEIVRKLDYHYKTD